MAAPTPGTPLLLRKTDPPPPQAFPPRSNVILQALRMVFISSCLVAVAALCAPPQLTRATFARGLLSKVSTTAFAIPTLNQFHSSTKMPSSLKSYYQLVVDANGSTSMMERDFTGVKEVGYSNTPQLLKKLDPSFASPRNVMFTSLAGENPWHYCPAPQIVVCLAGGWYIRTTDGHVTEFRPGDVLYQDNTKEHPAALEGTRQAMHFSGSLDDGKPCDQMIVQLDLKDGSPVADSKHAPPPM